MQHRRYTPEKVIKKLGETDNLLVKEAEIAPVARFPISPSTLH